LTLTDIVDASPIFTI